MIDTRALSCNPNGHVVLGDSQSANRIASTKDTRSEEVISRFGAMFTRIADKELYNGPLKIWVLSGQP